MSVEQDEGRSVSLLRAGCSRWDEAIARAGAEAAREGEDVRKALQWVSRLNLHSNDLTSLDAPTPSLPRLVELNISSNLLQLLDCSDLEDAPQLRSLDVAGNDVGDVRHIRRLPHLTHLSLAFNALDSLAWLGSDVWAGDVADLSTMQAVGEASDNDDEQDSALRLESLDLRGNRIADVFQLQFLRHCPRLRSVRFRSGAGEHENPVCGDPAFPATLLRMAPRLQLLDEKPLREAIPGYHSTATRRERRQEPPRPRPHGPRRRRRSPDRSTGAGAHEEGRAGASAAAPQLPCEASPPPVPREPAEAAAAAVRPTPRVDAVLQQFHRDKRRRPGESGASASAAASALASSTPLERALQHELRLEMLERHMQQLTHGVIASGGEEKEHGPSQGPHGGASSSSSSWATASQRGSVAGVLWQSQQHHDVRQGGDNAVPTRRSRAQRLAKLAHRRRRWSWDAGWGTVICHELFGVRGDLEPQPQPPQPTRSPPRPARYSRKKAPSSDEAARRRRQGASQQRHRRPHPPQHPCTDDVQDMMAMVALWQGRAEALGWGQPPSSMRPRHGPSVAEEVEDEDEEDGDDANDDDESGKEGEQVEAMRSVAVGTDEKTGSAAESDGQEDDVATLRRELRQLRESLAALQEKREAPPVVDATEEEEEDATDRRADEVEELSATVTALREELESRAPVSREEWSALQKEAASAKDALAQRPTQAALVQAELRAEEADQEVTRLRAALESSRQERETLSKQLGESQSAHQEAVAANERLTRDKAWLEDRLRECESERDEAHSRSRESDAAVEKMRQELSEQSARWDRSRVELEAQIRQLEGEKRDALNEARALRDEVESARRETQRLEADLASSKQEHERELSAAHASLQRRWERAQGAFEDELRRAVEEARSKSERWKALANTRAHELREALSLLETTRQHVRSLEEEVQRLDQHQRSLREAAEEGRSAKEEAETRLRECQRLLEQARRDNAAAEESRQKTESELHERVAALEKSLEQASQERNRFQQQADRASQELRVKITMLEDQNETIRDLKRAQTAAREEAQAAETGWRDAVAELRNEVSETRERAEESAREAARLKQALSQAEQEKEQHRTRHREVEELLQEVRSEMEPQEVLRAQLAEKDAALRFVEKEVSDLQSLFQAKEDRLRRALAQATARCRDVEQAAESQRAQLQRRLEDTSGRCTQLEQERNAAKEAEAEQQRRASAAEAEMRVVLRRWEEERRTQQAKEAKLTALFQALQEEYGVHSERSSPS